MLESSYQMFFNNVQNNMAYILTKLCHVIIRAHLVVLAIT